MGLALAAFAALCMGASSFAHGGIWLGGGGCLAVAGVMGWLFSRAYAQAGLLVSLVLGVATALASLFGGILFGTLPMLAHGSVSDYFRAIGLYGLLPAILLGMVCGTRIWHLVHADDRPTSLSS